MNTASLALNPSSGGMPASENMKIASANASPGRVRDRPDRLSIVSTGRPAASRIWSTTRNDPSVMTI